MKENYNKHYKQPTTKHQYKLSYCIYMQKKQKQLVVYSPGQFFLEISTLYRQKTTTDRLHVHGNKVHHHGNMCSRLIAVIVVSKHKQ